MKKIDCSINSVIQKKTKEVFGLSRSDSSVDCVQSILQNRCKDIFSMLFLCIQNFFFLSISDSPCERSPGLQTKTIHKFRVSISLKILKVSSFSSFWASANSKFEISFRISKQAVHRKPKPEIVPPPIDQTNFVSRLLRDCLENTQMELEKKS